MAFPKPSAPVLKSVRALSRKGPRSGSGTFIVEGLKLLAEAISRGWEIRTLLITRELEGEQDANRLLLGAKESGAEIYTCSLKDLRSVAATEKSQGPVAVLSQQTFSLKHLLSRPDDILVCLDGVQDPGNVGTCIRSADWFGAGGVILGRGCASVYNDKTVRASAGSVFHIPCVENTDLPVVLEETKKKGYVIVGADQGASNSYTGLKQQDRTILVLGSEASGFSPEVRNLIDTTVMVPRYGNGESLNVSIAAAVILSHIAHLRDEGAA